MWRAAPSGTSWASTSRSRSRSPRTRRTPWPSRSRSTPAGSPRGSPWRRALRSTRSCAERRSAPPLEPHHLLDDRLALLGDRALLGGAVRAVLAHLLLLPRHLHRLELVRFAPALF